MTTYARVQPYTGPAGSASSQYRGPYTAPHVGTVDGGILGSALSSSLSLASNFDARKELDTALQSYDFAAVIGESRIRTFGRAMACMAKIGG